MRFNEVLIGKLVLITGIVFSSPDSSARDMDVPDLNPLDKSVFVSRPPCNGASGYYHPNGGGFVAHTAKVSHTAYIGPNATVCDYAEIYDNVAVFGNARVSYRAKLYDWVQVYGNAHVTAYAKLSGHVQVFGDTTRIGGSSVLCGEAKISGDVQISHGAYICGENIELSGKVQVLFYGRVLDNTKFSGRELILFGEREQNPRQIKKTFLSTILKQ